MCHSVSQYIYMNSIEKYTSAHKRTAGSVIPKLPS